jgi:four helix bundle protein
MALSADPKTLLVSEVAELVAKGCAELARTLRGPGAFAIGDQIVRASVSVVSNVAEACVALGSAQETLAQLRVINPATDETSPDPSGAQESNRSRT